MAASNEGERFGVPEGVRRGGRASAGLSGAAAKPSIEDLRPLCPGVDTRWIAGHLARLGEDYFAAFNRDEIAAHLASVSRLSPRDPVQVRVTRGEEGRVDCTVIAFDYPAEFSLISGVLAGTGFSILSGDVFTYSAAARALPAARRLTERAADSERSFRRRHIIDRFQGRLQEGVGFERWREQFAERLAEVIRFLEADGEGVVRAKHKVNELVAARLGELRVEGRPMLYPVEIEVPAPAGAWTTLRIRSQDTPAFLYAMSNALALQGISIERVRIRTVGGRVEDEMDILDASGQPITDTDRLDRIKLSVLLTKQFTNSLGRAPDRYSALARFDQHTADLIGRPERGRWLGLLSEPAAMDGLARILGASDFLWEDFLRTQYEALLPMLGAGEGGTRRRFTRDALEARLAEALGDARDDTAVRDRVNAWKDREILLIDLDHILHAGTDVRALAEPLTLLAEIVVRAAVETVYRRLERAHGRPRTVGGLTARYAVCGLGKLGGVALGYASDIELLFVYSDSGETEGDGISNREFFGSLAEETAKFIASKREGIFAVDLRLRPFGNSGPKACSLESFCAYYGLSGQAHSYERLALTRLRFVAGDEELGHQVERLRDVFVYTGSAIRLNEFRHLRERQFGEKVKAGSLNAKFSPGALVDLEYYVQILQVMHGQTDKRLRTPRIHKALRELSTLGVLQPAESGQLTEAYYFLRRLINGLRMLRGNARDLFLPGVGSDEYVHLARRMGYELRHEFEPERQLFVDFETHTAVIRAFIERHFGRESLAAAPAGSVADLILSREAPADLQHEVLTRAGFVNVQRACVNLRRLAGQELQREAFARLAILACDFLKRGPDSDMALNNWERFVGRLPDAEAHFAMLLSQPKRLEILLGVFAGSQFLADTLVANPEFLEWVTDLSVLQSVRDRRRLAADLDAFVSGEPHPGIFLNALRKFRRREVLRIATRDICLKSPTRETMSGLSALADTLTDAVLRREWQGMRERWPAAALEAAEPRFCILALGKLGGDELNYSSDIDLLGVYDPEGLDAGDVDPRELFSEIMEKVRTGLSAHTDEGYAYRVDLRLRPHGAAGRLVPSLPSMLQYYSREAGLWEIQALLKARPVAGSMQTGRKLMKALAPVMLRERGRDAIVASITEMRARALRAQSVDPDTDVKSGLGGIRDVEFLVQGLQLMHMSRRPELREGNTLAAMELIETAEILPPDVVAPLRDDYVFLRRVEHFLQIFEDLQVHAIPRDGGRLKALARRCLGPDSNASRFRDLLAGAQSRIRGTYNDYLLRQ